MSKIVVIVEDNKDNLKLFSDLAQKVENINQIITSHDGEDGLEKIININPDLVILDIQLPTISGFDIMKKMKIMNITSKILVITAKTSESDIIKIKSHGCDVHVSKPISIKLFFDKVKELLC